MILMKLANKCKKTTTLKIALNPQNPQATVSCYVGAAALVHFRPGRPGPPARGFK